MSLNDSAVVVAVAKLAGLFDVSNEMIGDSAVNLTDQCTTLLRYSLSRQRPEQGGGLGRVGRQGRRMRTQRPQPPGHRHASVNRLSAGERAESGVRAAGWRS